MQGSSHVDTHPGYSGPGPYPSAPSTNRQTRPMEKTTPPCSPNRFSTNPHTPDPYRNGAARSPSFAEYAPPPQRRRSTPSQPCRPHWFGRASGSPRRPRRLGRRHPCASIARVHMCICNAYISMQQLQSQRERANRCSRIVRTAAARAGIGDLPTIGSWMR